MSENGRVLAPTADEVERRFRSPAVLVTRPAIIGAVGMLRVARRFGWQTNGIGHLNGDGESMLFAANHQSHVDTAAILGTLPRTVRNRTAVAAALDVFGHPGNGGARSLKRECLQLFVAAGFHAFAFDRQGMPLRSIRTAAQLLRTGGTSCCIQRGRGAAPAGWRRSSRGSVCWLGSRDDRWFRFT